IQFFCLMPLRFFFSSRRRHTRWPRDWSSDVCSSDLAGYLPGACAKRTRKTQDNSVATPPRVETQGVADGGITIDQALARAVQHHQRGELQQAEGIYRQILAIQPNNAQATHLLGVVAHQLGRNDVALELMQRSLA